MGLFWIFAIVLVIATAVFGQSGPGVNGGGRGGNAAPYVFSVQLFPGTGFAEKLREFSYKFAGMFRQNLSREEFFRKNNWESNWPPFFGPGPPGSSGGGNGVIRRF